MSYANKLSTFIRRHFLFLIVLGTTYLISFFTVLIRPQGFPVPELADDFFLFGPSLSALMLLTAIGGYLLYRYFSRPFPRTMVIYQAFWGFSFLLYSLTFLGLALQSFGFDFANMKDPSIFFIWRFPMILFVAGMWIGLIMLFTEDKKVIYIPSLVIVIFGLIWFSYGLLVVGDIEMTMYGFLFWEFIPICFVLSYIWLKYGLETGLSSPKILALGFILKGITYMAWAPWHFADLSYIYFIWFNIFIVALAILLAGFIALPKETRTKTVS